MSGWRCGENVGCVVVIEAAGLALVEDAVAREGLSHLMSIYEIHENIYVRIPSVFLVEGEMAMPAKPRKLARDCATRPNASSVASSLLTPTLRTPHSSCNHGAG